MNELIRHATMNDLTDIQSLNLKLFEKEQKEFDPSLSLDWTFGNEGTLYFKERILKDDGCVAVAVVDNTTVGYICGGITTATNYRNLSVVMAELENMFILETFRSKGLGKKLLEIFLEWCKNKHVGKIKVIASAENEKTINFYRANNFHDYDLTLEMDI